MVLNVVLLDPEENFVKFLDPGYFKITEYHEVGKVKRISFTYFMQSLSDARKLFRLGYKLWVSDNEAFGNLSDCLYVINTSVERDYFNHNHVKFEAEEVLVELNYAPLFNQLDLTEENGFQISTVNDEENVTVNYDALEFWFGDYFNIGVVQQCLSNYVSKIAPVGTMTKMELLRLIEEETSNVFVTRYQKDPKTNVIHRYLDFLNPDNNNKSWELRFHHKFTEDLASNNISLYDTEGNLIEEEIVNVIDTSGITPGDNLDVSSCYFRLHKPDGSILFEKKASDLGLTNNVRDFKANIKYNGSKVTIQLFNKTYSVDNWVDGQNAQASVNEESIQSNQINVANLPNHSYFRIEDNKNVWFYCEICPQLGDVHDEVLDLGFNVENIDYEIDESDTFIAISPVLGSENSSNKLTKSQLNTVIQNWLDLEVTKGEIIPMIVQRVSMEEQPTDNFMAQSNKSNNYYSRPVNPNDQEGNSQDGTNQGSKYEYWRASAYWKAPYTKKKGEMHVTDDSITDVEYTHISGKPDTIDPRGPSNSLKIGPVQTSDEDPYAIYNDVAMKLKDKKTPEINIEVDVANLINHRINDYHIHDKIFIKVPGFEKLITAKISKTEKEAHDLNKNKIGITNYSINTKVSTEDTYILGNNVSYTYPETSELEIQLLDSNNAPLKGQLVTFAVYYGGSSFDKSYTRTTKDNGSAMLPLRLGPGNYVITVSFNGDEKYSACEQSFSVNVGGTIEESTARAGEESTTAAEISYWSQYGISPDKKKIMAIGRPSVASENSYGYKFFKSVFERKCPHCGSTELYWSIFWAGNETSNWGRFPATGNNEGGSAEGHIFCAGCDADYSCILGKEHVSNGRGLNRLEGPVQVNKTEAYNLKNGQMVFEKKTVTVPTEANTASSRPGPIANDISETVKQKALTVAGASLGIEAAKKIANWVATNIKYENYNNFQRSPDRVLALGKGNCCDQTRLMLQMWDAAGVTSQYQLIYVHTVGGGGGHVFAKINGTYVDPCKASPWGNYVTGYGVPGSAPNSVYPTLPF